MTYAEGNEPKRIELTDSERQLADSNNKLIKHFTIMITSRQLLLMMLCFISCLTQAIAQTDYYYYKGNKIPLTLNEDKVCVSIPEKCNDISERFFANVQILTSKKGDTFNFFVITQSDYEKITSLDFWKEDAKSVIVTSSYFTENNDEVFETPYLTVKLKNEQNIDLLNSYIEEYKFRIVRNSQISPLWYTLSITPDSEKSSVECANELYETGNFASSMPDFVSDDLLDKTTSIPGITSATTTESTGIYDLQGRRLSGKPARGIYIEDGKKILY